MRLPSVDKRDDWNATSFRFQPSSASDRRWKSFLERCGEAGSSSWTLCRSSFSVHGAWCRLWQMNGLMSPSLDVATWPKEDRQRLMTVVRLDLESGVARERTIESRTPSCRRWHCLSLARWRHRKRNMVRSVVFADVVTLEVPGHGLFSRSCVFQ